MDMISNPFSLEGKTILVTGASSGIGRGCAIVLSQFGASVVLNGRDEMRLNETISMMHGTGHIVIKGDLTDDECLNNIVSQLPEIDGAILSAGILQAKPFLFSKKKEFQKLFDVNFFSTVELLRLLVKNKKLIKESSVVLISSVGSMSVTIGDGMYSSSKAALDMVMRQCAVELAPKRIRINSICPGLIETPLVKKYSEEVSNDSFGFVKDSSIYPLKRFGQPEDVAYGAVYLLSKASSWVTGQCLCIDGGISAFFS